MATNNEFLTLKVASLSDDLDAEAFLHVLGNTLRALQEVNKELSKHGAVNVEWRITKLGMSSPAFATLHGTSTSRDNGDYGKLTIKAFASGLQQLETDNAPPPKFNSTALHYTTNLVQSFARGVSQIEYSTNGTRIIATKKIAENANTAIQKIELERARKAGKYVEFGEIEGRLKGVSELANQDKIVIVDELTRGRIPCYFRGEDIEHKAREGWKHRVVVTGDITVDKITGAPTEVQVDDIRVLRSRADLPQIDDLLGFDITGGVDPVEYVRGLRDGE